MAQGRERAPTRLELVLADGATYPHRGVIVAVNRQIDATHRHDPAAGAVSRIPTSVLRPGQYGRVRMRRSDAGGNVLVVPEKALIQVQGTYSLAVVGAGQQGAACARSRSGRAPGTQRIVTSGVSRATIRSSSRACRRSADGAVVGPQPTAPARRRRARAASRRALT